MVIIDTLNSLIEVLLVLIGTSAIFNIAKQSLYMLGNTEEKALYIKKIKNSLIAVVVSMSIFVIVEITKHYFS